MPTSVEVGFACSVTRSESSSVRKINLLPFSFIIQIRSSNFQQQKLHSIIADDSICVKPYRELDGGAELATWCHRKDRWRGWVGDFGYESNDHGQKTIIAPMCLAIIAAQLLEDSFLRRDVVFICYLRRS
jgi:hypothetical protein